MNKRPFFARNIQLQNGRLFTNHFRFSLHRVHPVRESMNLSNTDNYGRFQKWFGGTVETFLGWKLNIDILSPIELFEMEMKMQSDILRILGTSPGEIH